MIDEVLATGNGFTETTISPSTLVFGFMLFPGRITMRELKCYRSIHDVTDTRNFDRLIGFCG